jgi:hypothetical protein
LLLKIKSKGTQMNITLRKANALQTAIQDHIKSIDLSVTVALNEFQDPAAAITAARGTLVKNDQRRADLTVAMYAIRALVGQCNASAGVSALLSRAAYIDKRLGQLKGLTESTATEEMAVVKGKLDKLSAGDKGGRLYGYSDTVSVGVLTSEQLDQFKADASALKKEKQAINDKVLELNIRTEITLIEDVVKILQSEQLI